MADTKAIRPTDRVGGDPMTPATVAWIVGWVALIVVITLFGNEEGKASRDSHNDR
jgi:hypothetical protein